MHNEFRSNDRKEASPMAVRLIGLDLDGTLLTDRKDILPETLSALNAAGEAGILIVPATGRPLSGVPEDVISFLYLREQSAGDTGVPGSSRSSHGDLHRRPRIP